MSQLETLLRSAEGQAKFLEWAGNDVTQIIVRTLREKVRPKTDAFNSGLAAAAELGRLRGIQEAIDTLTHRTGAHTQPGGAGLPAASYGARETGKE